MILVDTSVWVDHLRRENDVLANLLAGRRVLGHPYVLGELALGGISQGFIHEFNNLRQAVIAEPGEVLDFIRSARIAGRGLGYVDVHLLASARLIWGTTVWTLDKRLRKVADDMDISAKPEP